MQPEGSSWALRQRCLAGVYLRRRASWWIHYKALETVSRTANNKDKGRCALRRSKGRGGRMRDGLSAGQRSRESQGFKKKLCIAWREDAGTSSVRLEVCLLRCCFSLSNAQTSGISAASEDYSCSLLMQLHMNLNDQRLSRCLSFHTDTMLSLCVQVDLGGFVDLKTIQNIWTNKTKIFT